ncbi:MAG: CHAT domain-containing protein [Anaerolineales bacterium]|nr:CHAT domain-containing protein [Anaerolineales bacterium]
MPNSHAQNARLTCPACGREFEAEIWLVIDAAERPDLLEKVLQGSLHALPCPHCGQAGAVDAPLLIYRPGGDPPLVFSPAQGSSEEEDRQHAQGLLGLLRAALGGDWQAEWEAQVLAAPRQFLAAALSEDPQAALGEMLSQAQAEMERLRAEDPDAYRELEAGARRMAEAGPLLQAIQEFIQARDWGSSRRVVEAHPELLGEEADGLLAQMIAAAQAQGDANAAAVFEEHRDLLRRCRETSVEQAFAEKLGQSTSTGPSIPPEFSNDLDQAMQALQQHQRGDRAALDKAVTAWQRILDHPAFAAAPERFQLAALNDAGGVFLRRYWAQGLLADLDQALSMWGQAVQRTPPDSPDLPGYLNNLGTGLRARYARSGDLADLAEAIRVYQVALQIYTPSNYPERCKVTARNLGDLHFQAQSWKPASQAYSLALQAAEILYRFAFVPESQQATIQENVHMYDRSITCCAHMQQEPDARWQGLIQAEGGKMRTFLDQMGQAELPPPAGVPSATIAQEQDLLSQARSVEHALQVASLPREIKQELSYQRRALREQLEAIWSKIEQEFPAAAEYIALRRGETLSQPAWLRLAALLGSETALVEFYTLEDALIAFVLRPGWQAPALLELPISRRKLLYRFLLPYQDEMLLRRSGRRAAHAWLSLGEELLAPLEELLGDAALVYFIPHHWLHTLPLHALTVNGSAFIQRRAAVYAPSAAVLTRLLERQRQPAPGATPLVMGYTHRQEEEKLFYGEAQAVADLLGSTPLLESAANRSQLQARAPLAPLVHLSCHGNFNPVDPLASLVHLADGEFTARDWMSLNLHAELVTLSACRTGINQVGYGDEIAGMSRALLYAGAQSALLTLWSVDALTTLVWMLDFYRRTSTGSPGAPASKAQAFQQATLALRDNYPDPYHWAPFILVGDAR